MNGTKPSDYEIVAAFEKAMCDVGIVPEFGKEGLTPDGKLVRFHIKGHRKGTRNGWAVLFGDDNPAGEFGDWKEGVPHKWFMRDQTTVSPADRAEHTRRMEAAKAERERQRKESEGEAARLANLIWNEAVPVVDHSHPYLVRKGVYAYGLRTVRWPVRNDKGEVFRHIDDTLIVPILNHAGKIVSLQAIFPEADQKFGRDKDFLKNGKKSACFFVIGRPVPGQPIAFCEGYATGATIHEATGWCVVVAFDAYNVPKVAKVWREQIPDGIFVICADNDRWTMTPVENPGVEYARRAAAEVGARVTVPEFESLDGRPTDFNDLHVREGIEAVQAQVFAPVPAPAEPDPESTKTNGAASVPGEYYVPGNLSTFDTFNPFPDINGKGKPLPTAQNLAELCRRTGVIARYNVIKKDIEILVPGLLTSIDNSKEVATAELLDCMHRVGMPTSNFEGMLVSVAERRQYNPVATWIDSKPWDGKSRLQSFYDTVEEKERVTLADGRSLKEILMRKWMISAVAAAYEPNGVVARGVLTFVSKQNLGKTRWAKQLAPRDLAVVADGEVLNPADRDSVKRVVSKWIVELGEVDATFRRADIAALKGFISRDSDELRRPYARTESKYARRTIFFASVNDERFLHDSTGNTRWWTIHAVSLGEPAALDMQQVWAEVKALYDAGESWHLDPLELDALNGHNQNYESISPIEEMIDRNFEWSSPIESWNVVYRATEIAIAARVDRPTKKDVNEAAAYVVKRYGVKTKQHGKARTKVWLMPNRSRTDGMEGPF